MATEVPLTLPERRTVRRLRLRSQLLAKSALGPADAVRHLLAMQAQDFAAARWALAHRSPGTSDADVEAQLDAGTIVRSWPMRGTLHLVAPEDLRWILALTADRMLASAVPRQRQLGLAPEDLERARLVATEALTGGRALTRDELSAVFTQAGLSPGGQRCYHMIWYLAQTATVCLAGLRGRQQVFRLVDEWIPPTRMLDRDEALGELASRYFRGHGPATVRDLAWWSSLTLADARTGLAVARESLATLALGGVDFFLDPGLLDGAPAGPPSTLALPAFDELLLGYGDRSAVLDAGYAPRVVPGKNGLFLPVIVHGGAVVGTWRKTIGSGRVSVQFTPFVSLGARARGALGRDLARYADFLGLPLELAT